MYDASGAQAVRIEEARRRGLLDVDLSDVWAPFIFSERDPADRGPARPNRYRQTFIDLANDRVDENGVERRKDEHNYLEPFGIPPALSVLLRRMEEDLARACYAGTDVTTLRALTGEVGYWDRDRARRDYENALRDAAWLEKLIADRVVARRAMPGAPAPTAAPLPDGPGEREAIIKELQADARTAARIDRTYKGQARIRIVRAAQARLVCEGLLGPRTRATLGTFDLSTHEALADWERKNDIFGWGFLNAETGAGLARPPMELHLETLKRVLAERVADAAGILEDGSTAGRREPAQWKDESGTVHPVPNLVSDFVDALLRSIHVATVDDAVAFLRSHGTKGLASLHVAFEPPPLPPYYAARMDLDVQIDRGDVWYDFPFDQAGKPVNQQRVNFPHLELFVTWNGQHIPLVRWRTTIGSWRSEMSKNGYVYYRYKSSDVGQRVWRHIVAGPVWIPPDTTPTKDLLTRKVVDRTKGPQIVPNTDVMGPGFQSAYGLVMAIHDRQRGRSFWDNQIRTHGSVDYTSIARRFSHGCHRLVNNRAVRLFDFILRHRAYQRTGNVPIIHKRRFSHDGVAYEYKLETRGYYYELTPPVPVEVLEGRIMGKVKRPITAYVGKHGIDYTDASDPNAPITPPEGQPTPPPPPPPEPEP